MNNFTTEQKKQARKADLYEYLTKHHPDDFKCVSGCLRPYNNLSISIKAGFHGYKDFQNGEKGNNIDFLTKHMNYSIVDAVLALCNDASPTYSMASPPLSPTVPPKETKSVDTMEKQIFFPEQHKGKFDCLFAYLQSRGISNQTIQMLVDRKLIYQDEKNNIVFVSTSRDWGEIRGTNTYHDNQCVYMNKCNCFEKIEHNWCKNMEKCNEYKKNSFHKMVPGSRHDGFWHLEIKSAGPKKIFICESSIDAISLYELEKASDITGRRVYISIGGCSGKQPAIDRIKRWCHPILAVDNDEAGAKCRDNNPDLKSIIPKYKDWNEVLMKFRKKDM